MGDGGIMTPMLDYFNIKPNIEAVIVSDVDLLSGPQVRRQKYSLTRTPHSLFASAELKAVARIDPSDLPHQLPVIFDGQDEWFLRKIVKHLKSLRDVEEYQ